MKLPSGATDDGRDPSLGKCCADDTPRGGTSEMASITGYRSAKTWLLASAASALIAIGTPSVDGGLYGSPAAAQSAPLPKPYISRAIDATLMDITPEVRRTFELKPNVTGVLVLAADPNGIAAQNNILPGDIITDVRGKRVSKPIDVDTYVLYFLKKGDSAFQFAGNRGGESFNAAAEITLALFEAVIDFSDMGSWSSFSNQGFSYTEYYESYSEIIVEEYTYSETIIEETVTSESFEMEISEESSEETMESEEVTSESEEETASSEDDDEAEDGADGDDEADADEADDQDQSEGDSADEDDDSADEGDDDAGGEDDDADEASSEDEGSEDDE